MAKGILSVINGHLGERGLSLRQGTIVDAIIHTPNSTKSRKGKRNPQLHQTKKGPYFFGIKG